MTKNYEKTPDNLPIPQNDGSCDHLVGRSLPDLELSATSGGFVNLSKINGYLVIYCYPMTTKPGEPSPENWDAIPGARGCTPQSCSFRDHNSEIQKFNATVFGMSIQNTKHQKEMAERLHLPFDLLSDHQLTFCKALRLPTFKIDGNTFIKRVTLITNNRSIRAVHYPVFPSDSDPSWVLNYLKKSTFQQQQQLLNETNN